MTLRIAIPDMISPSYFPAIAAVELGYVRDEGHDASIELRFPVVDTYTALRDGELDYVGGAAHAALYAFPDWDGCRLVGALSQGMYWFLVVRADLEVTPGDLGAVRGLRIGAAPGPVDGLREALRAQGIDPDEDVEIGPVTAASGAGVSFGVTAAAALEEGTLDGFWANGMGAAVALRSGVGQLLLDARRGERPAGITDYTFPALVATEQRLANAPDEVRAVLRAVVRAQRALADDPELAVEAARPHFPPQELDLISGLIARDAAFYDPAIAPDTVAAMQRFASQLGITSTPTADYDQVVATELRTEWTR